MKRNPSVTRVLVLACAGCSPTAKSVGETLDDEASTSSDAAVDTGTDDGPPLPKPLELEWTELAAPNMVFQAVVAMPDGGATVTTATGPNHHETGVRRYEADGSVRWEANITETTIFPIGVLPEDAVVVAGSTDHPDGNAAATLWRLSATGHIEASHVHPTTDASIGWNGVTKNSGVWVPLKSYAEGQATSLLHFDAALELQWEIEIGDEGTFATGLVVDEASQAYLAFGKNDEPRWWVASIAPDGALSSVTEVPHSSAISRVDGSAHSLFTIVDDVLVVTHHDAQSLVMAEETFPNVGFGWFTVDGGAGFVVTARIHENTRSLVLHRPSDGLLHRTLELGTSWGDTVLTPLPALSPDGSIYLMVNENDARDPEKQRGVLHKLSAP